MVTSSGLHPRPEVPHPGSERRCGRGLRPAPAPSRRPRGSRAPRSRSRRTRPARRRPGGRACWRAAPPGSGGPRGRSACGYARRAAVRSAWRRRASRCARGQRRWVRAPHSRPSPARPPGTGAHRQRYGRRAPRRAGWPERFPRPLLERERRPAHERRPEPGVGGDGGKLVPGLVARLVVAGERRAQSLHRPPLARRGRRGAVEEQNQDGNRRGEERDCPQQLETVPKAHIPGGTPAAPWTDRGAADLPWKRTGEWAGGAPPATATIGGRRAQVDRAPRGYSSAGRAPGSHPGGRRFESG
jgi:hypothetical protein